jgi:hypothetical protein
MLSEEGAQIREEETEGSCDEREFARRQKGNCG